MFVLIINFLHKALNLISYFYYFVKLHALPFAIAELIQITKAVKNMKIKFIGHRLIDFLIQNFYCVHLDEK